MRNWLVKFVRLVGRGLVRWLELLGEHPPLSRHCWPGPHIARELAERARSREEARAEEAKAPEAPPSPSLSDRQPRRSPPRRPPHGPPHRRSERRSLTLGL